MDSGAANRKGFSPVGFDGESTVTKLRVSLQNNEAVPDRDDCLIILGNQLGWHREG